MKNPLDLILLVDDNEADNYLHTLVIKESGIAREVAVREDGEAALSLLKTSYADKTAKLPSLIFLDINMPRMNGWEFLQAYHCLPRELQQKTTIIMLTTSLHSDDSKRASDNPDVTAYFNKPLKVSDLEQIMATHFRDE